MTYIVKAYSEVSSVIDELTVLRSSDSMLHGWYVQADKLARELNGTPQVPRTAGRQQYHVNVEHSSVEEYYRRCLVLPLLDNFIQQMKEHFSHTHITVVKLLGLVPFIVSTHSDIS